MFTKAKKFITWIVLASMLLTNGLPQAALADELRGRSFISAEQETKETEESKTEKETPVEGEQTVQKPEDEKEKDKENLSGENENGDQTGQTTGQDVTPSSDGTGDGEPSDGETTTTTTTGSSENGESGEPADSTVEGEVPGDGTGEGETTTTTTTDSATTEEESSQGSEPAQENKENENAQPANSDPSNSGTTDAGQVDSQTEESTTAPATNPAQPEESKPEESKVEESKTEESKTEETKVEESKPEESKTEESKVEESKPEESKTEESKTEESKVEESKPEEPVSDPNADLETMDDWDKSVWESPYWTGRTGVWADDIVMVAKTQLGYKESEKNFIKDAQGNTYGWNRYAAWAGVDPYSDWCTLFILFCEDYAWIDRNLIPATTSLGVEGWVDALKTAGRYQEAAGNYSPKAGDLVFFVDAEAYKLDPTTRTPGHVGIVSAVDAAAGSISVIEGNNANMVQQTSYVLTDAKIVGYGVMPENPDLKKEEKQEAAPTEDKVEESVQDDEVQVTVATDTINAMAAGPFAERMLMMKAPMRGEAEGGEEGQGNRDGEGEGGNSNLLPSDQWDSYQQTLVQTTDGWYLNSSAKIASLSITPNFNVNDPIYAGDEDGLSYHIQYVFSPPETYSTGTNLEDVFDSYYNNVLKLKLPAGLLLKTSDYSFTVDPTCPDPTGNDITKEHTYIFTVDDPETARYDENDFDIVIYVGNNGTEASYHTYSFADDMLHFETTFAVGDHRQTQTVLLKEYTQSKNAKANNFTTSVSDNWGVAKAANGDAYLSDDEQYVIFEWKIAVGYVDPSDDTKVLQNDGAYTNRSGRDAITAFSITDAFTTLFDKTNPGTPIDCEGSQFTIKKVGETRDYTFDVENPPVSINLWDDEGTYKYLHLNTLPVDTNGTTHPNGEVQCASYTEYIVTVKYKITDEMIADFSLNTHYNLDSTNTVNSSATLYHDPTHPQTDQATATNSYELDTTKPAKLKIAKQLINSDGITNGYNNEFGSINYYITTEDGNIPFMIYTKASENANYEKLGGENAQPATSWLITCDAASTSYYYLTPSSDFSGSTEVKYKVTEDLAGSGTTQAANMAYVKTEYKIGTQVQPAGTESVSLAEDDECLVTITNKETKGRIRIEKKDNAGGHVTGAGFKIYPVDEQGNISSTPYGEEKKTGSSGIISFSQLPYGKYYIEESTVPPGYDSGVIKVDGVEITDRIVEINDTIPRIEVVAYNTITTAKITLTKYVGLLQEQDALPTAPSSFGGKFTLQRTTTPANPDSWTDVTGYVNMSLGTGGKKEITNLPSKDGNAIIYYRFKETIPTGYYDPVSGNTDYAYTEGQSFVGSDGTLHNITCSMYNRQLVNIKVDKNFYTVDSDGNTITENKTTTATLYSYVGANPPAHASGLTNEGQKTIGGSTQTWSVQVYSGTQRKTFLLKETDLEGYLFDHADGAGVGDLVTIDNEKYIPITIGSGTTNITDYTTRLYNYKQIIPVIFYKRDAYTNAQNITGSKFTIKDAENHDVYDAKETTKKLENVEIPGANGVVVYLVPGQVYTFTESVIPEDYDFHHINDGPVGTNSGTIDLTGITQPIASGGTKVYIEYIYNKPNPNIKITKTNSQDSNTKVNGVKFEVYVLQEGTTNVYVPVLQDNGQPVIIEVNKTNTDGAEIPSGIRLEENSENEYYYFHEIDVPSDYLDPDENYDLYHDMDDSYVSGSVTVGDETKTYTFKKVHVVDGAIDSTNHTDNIFAIEFKNIKNEGRLVVTKYVDGVQSTINPGFSITVSGTNPKTTGTSGSVTFYLPVYDENGDKIQYNVGEDLTVNNQNQTYYLDHIDGGTNVELELYDSEDPSTVKHANVYNKTLINILVQKIGKQSWPNPQNGYEFNMAKVDLALYYRESATDVWHLYGPAQQTNSNGTTTFAGLPRYYDYAIVEVSVPTEYSTYLPFKESAVNYSLADYYASYEAAYRSFLGTPPPDTIAPSAIDSYNVVYLNQAAMVNGQTMYSFTDQANDNGDPLVNRQHWVQFHVAKWADANGNHTADPSLDEQGMPLPPVYDDEGNLISTYDYPLDNVVFSLYRLKVTSGMTMPLTFSRGEPWELVGTYSTGTAFNADGERIPGQFWSDVEEGITDNYVYMLVEDSLGPNAGGYTTYTNEVYTFFHSDQHNDYTCNDITVTTSNGTVTYVVRDATYTMDKYTHTDVLNERLTGPGESEIYLATFRLSKWSDSYDENYNPQRDYEALANAKFRLYLTYNDSTGSHKIVLAELTSGKDAVLGNDDYALAQTGAFALENSNDEWILVDYENEEHPIRYPVDDIIEMSFEGENNQIGIMKIPVTLEEYYSPEPYQNGYRAEPYDTYLCFVDETWGTTANGAQYWYYNDLYFVKTDDKDNDGNPLPDAQQHPLAEDQILPTWYIVKDTNKNVIYGGPGNPQQQLRIVDYPVEKTLVTIHKLGYRPTEDTLNMTSAQLYHAGYRNMLEDVEMRLEVQNEQGGWDLVTTFKTDENGSYTYPGGLEPDKIYSVYETKLPNTEGNNLESIYEMAYTSENRRIFYVGGKPMDIYMANPEKLSLELTKQDINGNNIASNILSQATFTLNPVAGKDGATSEASYDSTTGRFNFDITTGTYYLTENVPGYTNAYLAQYFANNYSALADLLDSTKGIDFGYDYQPSGDVTKDADVIIQHIYPEALYANPQENEDPVLEITLKNPKLVNVELVKKSEKDGSTIKGCNFVVYYKPFDLSTYTAGASTNSISYAIPNVPVASESTYGSNNAGTGILNILNPNYQPTDPAWKNWNRFNYGGQLSFGTDDNGKIVFENVNPGMYLFFETGTPTISGSNNQRTFDILRDLEGRKFFYAVVVTGDFNYQSSNISLTPEEVTVRTYNPTGTKPVDRVEISSGTGANPASVEVENRPTVELKATKEVLFDDTYFTEPSWKVTLDLYTLENGTYKKYATVTLQKGTGSNQNPAGGKTFMRASNTGQNARFYIGQTYYLKEVVNSPSSNFDLDSIYLSNSPNAIVANQDGYYPITVTSEGLLVTAKNEYVQGKIFFSKWGVDANGNYEKLHDAKFEVYYSSSANGPWELLTNLSSNPKIAEVKEILEGGQKTGDYEVVVPLIAETDANGKVTYPTYYYRIFETESPNGYLLPATDDGRSIIVPLAKDDPDTQVLENIKDLRGAGPGGQQDEDEYILNTAGNWLKVYKYDNVKSSVEHIDYADADDEIIFTLYHSDDGGNYYQIVGEFKIGDDGYYFREVGTSNFELVEAYPSITDPDDNTTTITDKGYFKFLTTPGDYYAIKETGWNEDNFIGVDGYYLGNAAQPQNLQTITVGAEGADNNTDITECVIMSNVTGALTFNVYNKPLIKPTIVKIDVGGYPAEIDAYMEFEVYEIPAGTTIPSEKTARDAWVATFIETATKVFFGRTTLEDNTSLIGDPQKGTYAVWDIEDYEEEDNVQSWDPSKTYLLIETKVGSKTNPPQLPDPDDPDNGTIYNPLSYDTLQKDNSLVKWYEIIDPVTDPDPDKSIVFILKNVYGVATTDLEKEVVLPTTGAKEGEDLNDVKQKTESGETVYYVDTLLKDSRHVVYTIDPKVETHNQMLSVFEVSENGLTFEPAGATTYKITKIVVGKASHDTADAPIHAKVFINGNATEAVKEFEDMSQAQEYEFDDSTTVTSFRIVYFSPAIQNATETSGFALGKDFAVDPITVYVTVDKQDNGTPGNPVTEITKFTNTAHVKLIYPKWDNTGTNKDPFTVEKDDTAVIEVESYKLPIVDVEKSVPADFTHANPKGEIPYTIRISNSSLTDSGFVNPMILDILPTGVTFINDSRVPKKVKSNNNTEFSVEITPLKGQATMTIPTDNPDEPFIYGEQESALVIKLTGTLEPGDYVDITIYTYVSQDIVKYGLDLENDVYLSSTAHSYYTDGNPNGYPFLWADNTTTYAYDLESAADLLDQDGGSAARRYGGLASLLGQGEGAQGFVGNDPDNPPYYWVPREVHVTTTDSAGYSLVKAVWGDWDSGYHETGLGTATRTKTVYNDDGTVHHEQEGWVKWRLSLVNGTHSDREEIILGDVIAKVGDGQHRDTKWDVSWDYLIGIGVKDHNDETNAETTYMLDSSNYDLYFLVKNTDNTQGTTAQAESLIQEALVDPTKLTEENRWFLANANFPAAADKPNITAFVVRFKNGFKLGAGDALVLSYNTTVDKIQSDDDFALVAYENAVNYFYEFHKGTPAASIADSHSNTVSVTLLDGKVQIEGDLWIDEDQDGIQDNENHRDYTGYAIIDQWKGNFTFSITDLRSEPDGLIHNDQGGDKGAYGESIRHFSFIQLGPAKQITTPQVEPLYEAAGTDSDWIDMVLRKNALKTTDPYMYNITAKLTSTELLNIFKLSPLGQTHYMTDNPDLVGKDPDDYQSGNVNNSTLLIKEHVVNANTNAHDNNFYESSADGSTYKTNPFYVRDAANVDKTKDIGWMMFRELEIKKVAQDDLELPIPGAEFEIYGPFGDSAIPKNGQIVNGRTEGVCDGDPLNFKLIDGVYHLVRKVGNNYYLAEDCKLTTPITLDNDPTKLITDANGKIKIAGLNWWKEYDIKEIKAGAGYTIYDEENHIYATAYANGDLGTRIKEDEENDQPLGYKKMVDGVFTLKVPAPSKTVIGEEVTVRDPRIVEVPLNVEKILQTLSTTTQTFKFDLRLTDISGKDAENTALLKQLNADLLAPEKNAEGQIIDEHHILQTLEIEVDGTPKKEGTNWPYELSNFDAVTLNGVGTYTFTITEQVPTNFDPANPQPIEGIIYDTVAVRTVTVKIIWKDADETNNIEAGLYVDEGYPDYQDSETIAGIEYEKFVNKYEAKGTWKPTVYKILNSRDMAEGEEFRVQLFSDAAATQPVLDKNNNPIIGVATGGTNGQPTQFIFNQEIEYVVNATQNDTLTTHKYYIKEVVVDAEYNIVYDQTIREVTVTLTDNGNGTITATDAYQDNNQNFINEHLYSLLIHKLVDSATAGDAREFTFTMTLKKADGTPLVGLKLPAGKYNNNDVTLEEKGNGVYTFKLKHDQTIEVLLPVGATYEIVEKSDGYTVDIEVMTRAFGKTWTTPVKVGQFENTVGGTIVVETGDHQVTYNNIPGVDLPLTGGSGTVPFTAAGLVVLGSGLCYAMYLRKKKEREDDLNGSEGF